MVVEPKMLPMEQYQISLDVENINERDTKVVRKQEQKLLMPRVKNSRQ